ncbi:MAG: hypothetical protein AB7O38_08640 [Pirellulaceae bacterium]
MMQGNMNSPPNPMAGNTQAPGIPQQQFNPQDLAKILTMGQQGTGQQGNFMQMMMQMLPMILGGMKGQGMESAIGQQPQQPPPPMNFTDAPM